MDKNKKVGIKGLLAKNIVGIIVLFVIVFGLAGYMQETKKVDIEINLSELVNDINAEKVASIKNINDKIEITYKDQTVKKAKKSCK